MNFNSKSEVVKNDKSLSSNYKKIDKAIQSSLKTVVAAIHDRNEETMASAMNILQRCISEFSNLINDGERILQELSSEVVGVRDEWAVLADRREDFVRRCYFSKAAAKKLNKFVAVCEALGKDLNNADSCIRQKKIDLLQQVLKAGTKNLQRLRQEVDKLEDAVSTKPAAKRLSDEKLHEGLTSDYSKKKESWQPQVCYNAAMKVGVIEGNLPEFMRQSLIKEKKVNGYPAGFKKLMGVTAETVEKKFDHSKIEESGILNFVDDATGQISHTAYLQKTDKNTLEIYHANCQTLDLALLAKGQNIPKVGLVTHYELSDPDTQSRFQGWLDQGFSFKHTPASDLK
ncbi:hypothetical protein [Pseudovibrio denitrificans]|uniref:hypothetical protein n=1 Tax=Pseudovibrio denitrificans TaxID=258256 RepID=UPI000AB0286E|nr:hypothetical protein [Pseudovibrio denitrificans]